MDAQHQKTNKSAQFACYLREHTSSSSITSYIYLFALLFPPSIHLFLLYSAFKQDYPGKQATREGESFWGRLFFCFFLGHGDKRLRQELPTYGTLPPSLQTGEPRTVNCELRLGNQTTMCDYTKVEYACYHLRYTVRAWCKSTYFSGHPFLFSSLLFFPFFFFSFFFFMHIYLNVHGTADAFDMCVFRRQVPGDT